MKTVTVRFVIGELSEDDVNALRQNQPFISKMIISPDDFELFSYREGDTIEVESEHGNRQWCTITNLEVIPNSESVLLIFKLLRAAA